MSHPSILLVEDDDVDAMAVERAFKKANIANPLFKAKSCMEALEILRGAEIQRPIVVLLDLNMPKMGGLEFLDLLRADPILKPIPVVVLTSSTDGQDVWKAYNKHVSGYMTKSLDMDDFIEKMVAFKTYWNLCEIIYNTHGAKTNGANDN